MNLLLFAISAWLTATCVCSGPSSTTLYSKLRNVKAADGLHLPTYADWMNIPPYLQSVLISIDDKLRDLETFSHTLRLARLDFSLEQLVRRLDNIETKIGALQTKFDVKIDKVEEVVIAKDIKEDFSNDQLSRSIREIIEKLNNKFVFIDAKLDLVSERVINYVNQMERSLQGSHNDIVNKLNKIEERQERIETESKVQVEKVDHIKVEVNRVKMLIKDDVMSLLVIKTDELQESIKVGIRGISEQESQSFREMVELKESIGTLRQVPHQVNKTMHKVATTIKKMLNDTCSVQGTAESRGKDGSLVNGSHNMLKNITNTLARVSKDRTEQLNNLDSDMNHFMRKVYNGIQELWRSSDLTKEKLAEALRAGNVTRDYLKTQFNNMREEVAPLSTIQPQVNQFKRAVASRINELGRNVDKSFETMIVTQNHFINSCQNIMKIQEELPTITLVLHSMLVEMQNKSDIKELQNFMHGSNAELSSSLERLHKTIEGFHSGSEVVEEIKSED